MGRFNFVSPGAAMVEELSRTLAEREAKRRQDFLDALTLRREDRNDEIQRAQADSLTAQRDAMNDVRRQTMAKGVVGMMKPGQTVDKDTSKILREGGLGVLIRQGAPKQGAALDPSALGPNEGDELYSVTPGQDEFTGTPDQLEAQKHEQALQQYLNDPNTPEEVKQAIRYKMNTGDNAPAGMFGKKEGSKTAAVQEYEYYAEQEKAAGHTPKSFDEYQAMDANRKKPAAPQMTDAGFSEKETARFLSIAGAADRSPLVRAVDRSVVLNELAKQVKADPQNRSNQMGLAYGFIQALDTYQSAVREGELGLIQGLHTKLEQLGVAANRIYNQGAFMSPELAKELSDAALQLTNTIKTAKDRKMKDFRARARTAGVGDMWEKYVKEMEAEDAPAGAPAAAPAPASAPAAAAAPNAADLRKKYGY